MSGRIDYDAVVVGGGHNGLVAAAYLGKAGLKVLVAEAGEQLGGGAVTHEFHPGYRVSTCAHLLHLLHPRVVADLDLPRHGLAYAAADLPTTALLADGARLTLTRDAAATAASLARFSPRDAAALPAFTARLHRLAEALGRFRLRIPPGLGANRGDWRRLAGMALTLRRLGRRDLRELARIVAMNAADLLDDSFESDALKGLFAFDSVLGGCLGPRSPNGVFNLLYRAAGAVEGRQGALALPKGGMGAVAEALAAACRAHRVDLHATTPVERVLVENDRAVGVVLASGAEVFARAVLSNADPRRTLLDLVGPQHFDTGFVRRLRGLAMNGCAAKVHLALDGLPEAWRNDPAAAGRMVVAPSIDDVERAYDAAKYGEVSAEPAFEAIVPTIHDPSLAPDGGHVVSVVAQFAPYALRGLDVETARHQIGDRVVVALVNRTPELAGRIRAREVLVAQDLERRFRLTGGHWHQGELGLDRVFFLRPVGGFQRYRTPLPGLYLCGAGTHPGGGVSGAPGANAARAVAQDLKAGSAR